MIWTTFEHLNDAINRQYFKGAHDVIAISMATVQLSEKSLLNSVFSHYLQT